ncbi:MAG: phosphomannomutase/phosphoglucomutase [bacterium]|nr:phosphomannomutase/phosphoglucomutase [bacterium]
MKADIFHAYDIRGLSPSEIDEPFARRLGKTLVHQFKPKTVVVGRDMRETSQELKDALIEGLTSSGANVIDIGLCSTPMFNFAVGEQAGQYDLGIMVTASHNPAVYNGFKISKGDCTAVGLGSGLEAVRDTMISDEPLLDASVQGTRSEDLGVLARYVEKVWQVAALSASMAPMRVAMDAGNGMEGYVLPVFMKTRTVIEPVALYWELDGTFPNHEANPSKPETTRKLQESVVTRNCHFGVAFDGDADRVGFVDERGERIPGDIVVALLAKELLREHAGAAVVYDLRCSWAVREIIEEAGGRAVISPVGHPHMKQIMKEEQAVFGGELSAHLYFASMHHCEASDLAMLLIAKIMARENKKLSELWKPLQRYAHSGEINFTVKNKEAVLKKIAETYADKAQQDLRIDGIRMEFSDAGNGQADWWFSVRASNTEPCLRLIVEARTTETMERHQEALTRLITGT